MVRRIFPSVVALGLMALPASAFVASNALRVDGPASGFEVVSRGGNGAPAFWCAAGEYAGTALGLGATDRIWRTSPTPRGAGAGMTFATQPGAQTKTGLAVLSGDDGSLSVAAAQQLCWGYDDF